MNPTSLFTNLLSLVPRPNGEGRPQSLQDEGPRFELPELPDTSSRAAARHELTHMDDRRADKDEHEYEREPEPEPRAELVLQRGPDELAARGFEEATTGDADDALGFDPNGRPRTMRGQGDADMAGKPDSPSGPRDLEASPDKDPFSTTNRTTSTAPAQADAQRGHAQSGQPQSGPAQQNASQSGQAQTSQSSVAQGQVQGQNQPTQTPAALQAQNLQTTQPGQVAPLVQAATQATTPVAAQIALAQQPADASLEAPAGLDDKALGTSETSASTGLDALLEAGLDGLGLKLSDRVLGVGANTSLSSGATQTPADLSGEVADAVQRLLADAADESSLLRFRTESGQTFLAQARLEPGQPMELRLLSDDPGIRAMLAERLHDLRSALGRVGFGDAEVQVDRDPTQHGEHSRHPDDRDPSTPSLDDSAPRPRRPAYGAPDHAQSAAGRLHLIL